MNVKKVLIGMAIAGLVTGGIWLLSKYGSPVKRKAEMAQYLVMNGFNHDLAFLLAADDDYIKNWYKAAKANKEVFEYNNKFYLVKGGKAKVI